MGWSRLLTRALAGVAALSSLSSFRTGGADTRSLDFSEPIPVRVVFDSALTAEQKRRDLELVLSTDDRSGVTFALAESATAAAQFPRRELDMSDFVKRSSAPANGLSLYIHAEKLIGIHKPTTWYGNCTDGLAQYEERPRSILASPMYLDNGFSLGNRIVVASASALGEQFFTGVLAHEVAHEYFLHSVGLSAQMINRSPDITLPSPAVLEARARYQDDPRAVRAHPFGVNTPRLLCTARDSAAKLALDDGYNRFYGKKQHGTLQALLTSYDAALKRKPSAEIAQELELSKAYVTRLLGHSTSPTSQPR